MNLFVQVRQSSNVYIPDTRNLDPVLRDPTGDV